MHNTATQIIEWIDKLIDEKVRLEAIKTNRDELLKRHVSNELINTGIDDARKKVSQAKVELVRLLAGLNGS